MDPTSEIFVNKSFLCHSRDAPKLGLCDPFLICARTAVHLLPCLPLVAFGPARARPARIVSEVSQIRVVVVVFDCRLLLSSPPPQKESGKLAPLPLSSFALSLSLSPSLSSFALFIMFPSPNLVKLFSGAFTITKHKEEGGRKEGRREAPQQSAEQKRGE